MYTKALGNSQDYEETSANRPIGEASQIGRRIALAVPMGKRIAPASEVIAPKMLSPKATSLVLPEAREAALR